MSLKDAVGAGIAGLTSKGGFDGDVIAVDADWDRVPPQTPVKIRVNIEFVRGPGAPSTFAMEHGIEGQLSGLTASDGTPVSVNVVALERGAGDPATPCFHEVRIADDVPTSYVDHAVDPHSSTPVSGEWKSRNTMETDAHETLHLAGLEDQYDDAWHTSTADTPIPKTVDSRDDAALEEWSKSVGLSEKDAYAWSKPRPGHEKDIMGDDKNPDGAILQSDVDRMVERADVLAIHGEPGDVLVSKSNGSTSETNQQNLVVGADFDLDAHRGQHAHVDGLVAYCLDFTRHIPEEGVGYDVLGPAREQPGPAMAAIDAIAHQAALRQPAPLASTPWAQAAIWRVSDNQDPGPDQGILDLLAAAGVPADTSAVVYDAPHFLDANAGSARSAAITTTGVLAPPPLAPPTPPPGVVPAHITSLRLTRRSLGTPVVLSAQMTLQGAQARVGLRVERRVGRRWTLARRLPARLLPEGENVIGLLVSGLRAGPHRLVATASGAVVTAPFTVRPTRHGH